MLEKSKVFTGLILAFLMGFVSSQHTYAQFRKKNKTENKQREAAYYFVEAEKYYILEDYPKAYVLFQKSLESDPNNGAAHFKIAQILVAKGEFDEALLNANKAIKLDKDNKYYFLIKAEILTRQSNFAAAAQVYDEMINTIPGTKDYLFDLAALYIYQSDYASALETYEVAEEKFGVVEEVIRQKQKIYLEMNKLDKAIAEGKKLINAFPGEAAYVVNLAEIYQSNGRAKDAIPILEELLKYDANNPEARLMLARIYQDQGQTMQALENYEVAFASENLAVNKKVQLVARYLQELPDPEIEKLCRSLSNTIVEAHPDDANAYVISGDFYTTIGEDEAARNNYLEAVAINGNNFNVWQNVINIELELGKMDAVLEHSEKAMEYFPNQAILFYFNGFARMSMGDYNESARVLEQGKRLAGNNDELLSYFNGQLGQVYHELEEHKKSDEAYEAVLAYNPENDLALNNYSYFLSVRKEKLDYALELSSRLVERTPENAENPTYLDTHAWVLYQKGEYRKAKEFLEKAIRYGEGNLSGTIIEHYGDVLFKLNKVDEAVVQWKRAKGMDDTSDLIDKKIADRKLYE